jgi:hypothetical protein
MARLPMHACGEHLAPSPSLPLFYLFFALFLFAFFVVCLDGLQN